MKTNEFITWLTNEKKIKPLVALSRASNCRKVEKEYGDLDSHYELDKGVALLTLLKYSKEDERQKRPTKSNIILEGNIYNGLATLRQAIRRYIEFKEIEN
jgi:hypothetical protein